MRIAVMGAGVSGLAMSLALGRDGHDVVLIERDEVVAGHPLDAPGWKRQGIPHFLQAHRFAAAVDDLRHRRWTGEAIDVAHRDGGAYPLFTLAAGSAAALVDGDVFRTVVRRNYLLDPLSVLDDDVGMQQRIERIFAELRANPQARSGPAREELLASMQAALATLRA